MLIKIKELIKIVWWMVYLKRFTMESLYRIHFVKHLEDTKVDFVVDHGYKFYNKYAKPLFDMRLSEIKKHKNS